MYLIVGLGNPGKEYEETRHNMGFDTIYELSRKYNITIDKDKFQGLFGIGTIESEKVILFKPQTYMNLSGEAVAQVSNFYKINNENILIIYDDIDVLTGNIKIRKQGGPGTHNGMKSIVKELNTESFPRIRIGTGSIEKTYNLIDYVITKVNDEEYKKLKVGIDLAKDAVSEVMKNGIDIALNKYN